jgi:hypothetical protein
MKLPETRYFIPPPSSEEFAIFRFSQAFYHEVAYRQAHEQHCRWYAETVARNRAEFKALKGDINLYRWFRR